MGAHPVTGMQYVIPDQATALDDVEDTTTTTVIRSSQELSDYYANRFGIGIGVPGLFSLSFGEQSSTHVFYGAQSLLLLTDEDMPFYEILISELQPSDELLASVAKLPLEYDAAAYALFVETYGTHFV